MDETQLLYSICLHGRGDLGLAPDEYAALTMVLLRLLAFKPNAYGAAEKKTLNSPAAQASAPRVAPVAAIQATLPASSASVAAKPAFVQPWDDAPVAATAAVVSPAPPTASVPETVTVPPGHVLPVRTTAQRGYEIRDSAPAVDEDFESNEAAALVDIVQAATKVVAVPVRQLSETRADATAAQAAPVLIPTEEGSFWHTTVQQLIAGDAINAMVRELALQSQLVGRDTDQWLLRVDRESLNLPGTRDRLAAALKGAGFDVTLAVEIGRVTDSPSRRNNAASQERQLAAEKIIFDTPFVQTMMRDFGAKIVPGSIKPL
jgi:DNA polymerase-3 subunit gamma/tau